MNRRPGINVGDVVRIAKRREEYQRAHVFHPDESFEVTFREARGATYVLYLKGRDTGAFVMAKPSHCRISAKNPALKDPEAA